MKTWTTNDSVTTCHERLNTFTNFYFILREVSHTSNLHRSIFYI